ncbi:SDR family oxidoreductase [Myxococcota bacterium]|nr:SDR family oxidoreductase [Myxococcota bacterium]
MKVQNQIIVVTGAASGIGRALVRRFAAEGTRAVVAVDLNGEGAEATAAEVGGLGLKADVSVESDIVEIIEVTESRVGPIDLFCSNAGIGMGMDLESPNVEWQMSWDVNVMSHVYAARHLVPRMISRSGGYFMNTSSAAGLLNQIGGAAYGVSKHAAVGFGEWLALTHQHQGIRVSMLCPQAVRTPMVGDTVAAAAAAGDGLMEPERLTDFVIEGLAEERFLILPHPEVLDYMRRKTADYDRWVGGMNRLHQRLSGQPQT